MDFSTVDISDTTKELTITFIVPEKDCIYKDFISFSAHEPHITVSPWKANRETVNHYDSSFKETKPAFNETFSITMTATTTKNPSPVHLYCSYYRQSEKRINHALFSFSFPELSSPEEPTDENSTDSYNENSSYSQTTFSHHFYTDDYFRTVLSAIKITVYAFTIDYKNYIIILIFLITLLFCVSYFCRKQLLHYTKIKEFIVVAMATLLIICGTSLLVRFYTTQNALLLLILSCISSFIAGLLYIKKSTALVYKPLGTFCSFVGICLIISALFLTFKTIQCADEQFNLFF